VFSEDDWAIFLGATPSQPVNNPPKVSIPAETMKMETISSVQKKS